MMAMMMKAQCNTNWCDTCARTFYLKEEDTRKKERKKERKKRR